jgi:alpha,alpha-trehalase
VIFLLLQAAALPPSPAERYGPLFHAVQMARLYPDSKTFADAIPRRAPAAIMARYKQCRCDNRPALAAFVRANFSLPVQPAAPPPSARLPLVGHIDALWPQLTRTARTVPPGASALPLPHRFVVPGGRFRELYYWDSWFTMLGLQASGRQDLVEDMVANFGDLLDRYGLIPNGTRSYYLGRSQPPVFYLMADLSQDERGRAQRLRWMRTEHRFWMRGEAGLAPGAAAARVVRLADGALLNRYWDDRDTPRDESWREDVALADSTPTRPRAQLFRDLRAAAESGWDFSSRWLADGRTLATIRTTELVPVDLNSLLHGLEQAIARDCRRLADLACATEFDARAATRGAAIRRHLWHPHGYFADYDLARRRVADPLTAATAFPLFAGIATPDQARATARSMAPLIASGGLLTTPLDTGQQWDAPNGWAPLQWIAITGLSRYGEARAAARIRTGWLATVDREYRASGKLLEKYDVRAARAGGGGEYPTQDGFGWTNGVTRALLAE